MVEGPGATRNGDKLQCAVGKVISKAAIHGKTSDFKAQLMGSFIIDVFTLGKELFIIIGKRNNNNMDNNEKGEDDVALLPSPSSSQPLNSNNNSFVSFSTLGNGSDVQQESNGVIDLTEDSNSNDDDVGLGSHVYEPLTAQQIAAGRSRKEVDHKRNVFVEQKAIRLHFGMNGSVIVSRGGKETSIPPWRRREEYNLRLELINEEDYDSPTSTIHKKNHYNDALKGISKISRTNNLKNSQHANNMQHHQLTTRIKSPRHVNPYTTQKSPQKNHIQQ